jgi:hypothetical protein
MWWITMDLLNEDLKAINFQFLMLVRECARHNPMEAIWKFNLTEVEIERISIMPMGELTELATCGRAVFTFPPITRKPEGLTATIAAAILPVSNQTPIAE